MMRRPGGSLGWWASLLLLLSPGSAGAHPMHTSLTRIRVEADGRLAVSIRTFADDFSAAVANATKGSRTADYRVRDVDAAEYLSRRVILSINGRRIPLELTGQRRDGDVTWLDLRGAYNGSLNGARIANRLLMERYRDQVNIVQVTLGDASRTLLFAGADHDKTLW
jgi:hypothetical protein